MKGRISVSPKDDDQLSPSIAKQYDDDDDVSMNERTFGHILTHQTHHLQYMCVYIYIYHEK